MDSLEELSLRVVVQDFDRFYFAFTTSKDETLKKCFNFLQRKFSFRLCSELFGEDKLIEEYMDFLINEHLKELDCLWLEDGHYLFFMEEILCRLPNLTRFSCSSCCSDKILENVALFCPKIVEINIRDSSVTNKGIQYLCKDENGTLPCPELKKLLVNECFSVTDDSIRCFIRDLPLFEVTDYPNVPKLLYDLHKADLPQLKNVRSYELVDLDLSAFHSLPYYFDLLQVCLNVCPKLQSLRCCISDEKQIHFFNNTKLKDLSLKFLTTSPNVNIDNLLKNNGKNLVSLELDACILSVCDLIVNCPKLKHLYLNTVNISDDDSKPVTTSLVECTFQNTPKKEMIFLLLSSPKLKCISFDRCILFTEIKTHILKLVENRSVEELTFERCWVETSFIKDVLLNCSSSMELFLINCDYSARGIIELREFADTLNPKPKLYITGHDDSSEEETDWFGDYDSESYVASSDSDYNFYYDDMGSPSD